ncbi:alpha/beta fold hydrolase [Massilia sp. NP310]|jgi:pimeloyl-ACP methyl ester carboxylesterase|uniref:alpha/beta fold hydrolase n=1 Tax=Massilia sp. NP310 TaxID=2861282 RepID=UPI001C629BE7|nr:alpha/beta fold hydrolase [Massilia sp. NP310]QYG01027.1 alpha/beta hydrolase [Massilia sp. NP310]
MSPQTNAGRNNILSIVILLGCLSMSGSVSSAPATASVDMIAGRQVESLTIKNPSANVSIVFENGLRATVDGWDKVIDSLVPDASIFAYNRPGYGNSQETGTARDGATIVEELRQTLRHKGLAPPYILVGHSLGGLYMQLFAKRYPQEVSGLVLVDPLLPGVVKKSEEFPVWTRGAKRLFFSSTVNKEIDAIHQTSEQVLSLAPIDDKPIVMLINKPSGSTAVGVDFGAFNKDQKTRELVSGLYPKAKKIVVDSDHQVQRQNPADVVNAIRNILAKQPAGVIPPQKERVQK